MPKISKKQADLIKSQNKTISQYFVSEKPNNTAENSVTEPDKVETRTKQFYKACLETKIKIDST